MQCKFPPRSPHVLPRIGPHSRPGKLALIDGRRSEARLMARVRDDLTRHVGGNPSVAQKLMIDQAATLTLRLHLMDRAAANDPVMSERNSRQYLAWANSLTRLLSRLDTAPAQPVPMSPQEALAAIHAAYPATAAPA